MSLSENTPDRLVTRCFNREMLMPKAVCAMLIGIAFLFAAIIVACSTVNFIHSSIVTQGHVVKLNAGGSHPEIVFVTRDGKMISYPQGGTIFGMKVGDEVSVRYLPDAPLSSATLDHFGAIWDNVIFFGFMAMAFVVLGLLNLNPRKRRNEH